MELVKESVVSVKRFLLSLLLNVILGAFENAKNSFVVLQYFDKFWTNWVLFISF